MEPSLPPLSLLLLPVAADALSSWLFISSRGGCLQDGPNDKLGPSWRQEDISGVLRLNVAKGPDLVTASAGITINAIIA
jgi:hypothetical protein